MPQALFLPPPPVPRKFLPAPDDPVDVRSGVADAGPVRSPDELRHNLAQAVLRVRAGRATSRRTLADALRLSPTTAGQYADQLIAAGWLRESGLERGATGRPKRRLEAVAEAGWFVGVEFHAERVRAVGVDFAGRKAGSDWRSLTPDADAVSVLDQVRGMIGSLRERCRGPLLGIGFGAPGIVDPERGIGVEYAFMKSWRTVPVGAWLRDACGVPVTLENNLRAIALAERWFGGARAMSDFVVLGPRSGFGIALVLGGRLVRGFRGAAGEIGYWPGPGEAEERRVHDRLSSPAVWRRLSGCGKRAALPTDLHGALRELAGLRGEAWDEVIRDAARLLASLQWLLDPEAFFLHGPLTALGDRFCREIEEAAFALGTGTAPGPGRPALRLVASSLGDDAGALGAASLAMEHWRPGGGEGTKE
jgi:predicted NBD/HSP70 family sugar kinase